MRFPFSRRERDIVSSARILVWLLWVALLATVAGCQETDDPFAEDREACSERDPLRRAFFGDLHLHTGLSFDAWVYGNHASPDEAYRFAQGDPLAIPTMHATQEERVVRLERPLDFAMVSDHAEYLAEVGLCTEPGTSAYDSPVCRDFREGGDSGVAFFGMQSALEDPERFDLCGQSEPGCFEAALAARWEALQAAAEAHYDRTSACEFVTFVGYEFTATPNVVNLHRNVIFRGDRVPPRPITYYEAGDAYALWRALEQECIQGIDGCDVMTIGHNSNLSNGNYFHPDAVEAVAGAHTEEEAREAAQLRQRMEPLVEIFQHKGDMECRNGLQGVDGADDPLCDFEKQRPPDDEDCGDWVGSGGMRLWGCVSRYDFVRYALKEGLAQEARLGVNPYKLGLVGATDTHNATAGYVLEHAFHGHVGDVDNTPLKRLGAGNITHDTLVNNPGGITGVWAEERSRRSIFEALRRREVFATSGPRIRVRLFGAWDLPPDLCTREDAVALAYQAGVPMGADLPALPQGDPAPTFWVWAKADPGTEEHAGVGLQRLQVIKGWREADGTLREAVYEVAGDPENGAAVDLASCTPQGEGDDTLCAVWTDPGFDPAQRAFYYVRAVQNPTCRWSTWDCLRLDPGERPPACDDPAVHRTIQERAWSSPIWYTP